MGKPNGTVGSDSGTNRARGVDGVDNGNGHIRTYLRVRPSKDPFGFIKIDEFDRTKLAFHVPVEHREGEYVNNTRTTHNFKFDGVLGENSTQQDVFSKVGKGAIGNVLDGYNSTVFAYGQTGSGKTFTVTGGAERYVDRGLIPRALSLLFAEFKKRSDQQFNCYISYLEIYNEQGFDLLDPSHEFNKLEDLPRVSLREDEGGNIHLRQHIPYRNSMMTSVLRDSLGGNCKTVMIATINAEAVGLPGVSVSDFPCVENRGG